MQQKEAAEVEIIKLLKAAGSCFISGQSISNGLGISRTAIWKHIKNLREMGYSIEASPSKGYRLADIATAHFNEIEVSYNLSTEFVGRKIYFYHEIDSTNIKAFELGRSATPEGTVIIADTQAKGKGRIGRRWESPAGVNLYTSIILRPDIPPQSAHNLTFVSAVAVAEAISLYSPIRPVVKWPNDILLDSKKVAGILMEMDSEIDRVHFVVAGIGVNLNMTEAMLPDFLRPIATSVCEKKGGAVNRAEFAGCLYASIEKWYKIYLNQGFTPVLEEWKRYFGSEGKRVRVVSFTNTFEGICMGVDSDGALLVKNSKGVVERVISGDVETLR